MPQELMPVTSIGDVLNVIDETSKSTDKLVQSAQQLVDKTTAVAGEKAAAVRKVGENKIIIEDQKQVAMLEAENQVRKLFEAAGGASHLLRLNKAQLTATDDMLREQEEVAANLAHESDGLFDYIGNRIDLFYNSQELEAATQRVGSVNAAIQGVAATTEANAQILNKTAQTRTQATIAAVRDNIAFDTQIAASEAELEALRNNAAAYEGMVRAEGLVFDNVWKAYQAGQNEENQQQRRKEYELNVKRLEHQMNKALQDDIAAGVRLKQAKENLRASLLSNPTQQAKRELELQEATEQAERSSEARTQLVSGAQRGEAILGLKESTSDRLLSQYALGGEAAKKVLDLFLLGAEGSDVAGADASEVLINMTTYNPELLATSNNPVIQTIVAARDAVEEAALKSGTKLTKQQATDQVNATTKELLKSAEAEIGTGDNSNPYVAPPFKVLSQMASVESTPFYQKILKPMELVDTNPQQLFDLGIEAIATKTATIEEVSSGIQAIFRAAGAHNNEFHGFTRFGVPNQATYNSRLRASGFFGDITQLTDITDVTAIKSLLIQSLLKVPELQPDQRRLFDFRLQQQELAE